MHADEVVEEIRAAVAELTGGAPISLGLHTRLREDLDIDSLAVLDLVMILEERTGLVVDDAELDGVETVGDAVAMVLRLIDAR
ncbi:MAG: Acyl carrier protein [Acidimicrobiales bacterium]|nr:Acyl carrier protein [Acidimicrobiales bacterium]